LTEIERIVDLMERAFDGQAWHGPSAMELLSDVDPDQAAARPLKGRHTIWELVLHIAAWEIVVRGALSGENVISLSEEEDWPPIRSQSEAAWGQAVDELKRVHRGLVEAVSEFSESRLNDTVGGRSYSFYRMIHGVIQHDLYHAGQIAVLKRK
jgi:uncharacterized damage-inducible protein DinB